MCAQRSTPTWDFTQGQSVLMRDYRGGNDKWIPGTIAGRTRPVSYRVQVDPMTQWRRHADQIMKSQVPVTLPIVEIPESITTSSTCVNHKGKNTVLDSKLS